MNWFGDLITLRKMNNIDLLASHDCVFINEIQRYESMYTMVLKKCFQYREEQYDGALVQNRSCREKLYRRRNGSLKHLYRKTSILRCKF